MDGELAAKRSADDGTDLTAGKIDHKDLDEPPIDVSQTYLKSGSEEDIQQWMRDFPEEF